MKTIERLVTTAAQNVIGERKRSRIGNHSFKASSLSPVIEFAYHGNIVCYWNRESNHFMLDDCGWKGYPSTTRTLNDYRRILSTEYGAKELA